MLVYYFVPFIVSNRYFLFWVSNGNNSVTVQNRTHVYTNFFHHKDLGNHLLQLCPKVVKHPVFTRYRNWNTLYLQGTETETPCIYKVQKLKHNLKKCQFSNQLVKMRTISLIAQGAVSECWVANPLKLPTACCIYCLIAQGAVSQRWVANPLKLPTAWCIYCQTHWIFSPVAPLWFPWAFHTQDNSTWPHGKKCRAIKSEEHAWQKVGPTQPV